MLLSGDNRKPLILDACTVINLAATGHMLDIIAAIALPVVVCHTVANETLYLRRGGSGADASKRDAIDLETWIAAGSLRIMHAKTDEELETHVGLALVLDDGEAMTIALAVHHSLAVVTDDRKAARVASELVPVESSLALVEHWIEADAIDTATAGAALGNISDRGRYVPHARHLLRGWWDTMLDDRSQP